MYLGLLLTAGLARSALGQDKVKNIGYIMQGYNAYYGNPASTQTGVDPGFVNFAGQQVFEESYTEGHTTADGRYSVPDGFDLLPNVGCRISFATESEYKVSDYKDSLENKASFSAGYLVASFSASDDYKSFHEQTSSAKHRAITSVAECVQFSVTRRTYENPSFSTNWVNGLATLPSDYGDGSAYFDFLDAFGTHMMTHQKLGSRFGFTAYFDQKGWTTVAKTGVDVKAAAGYEGIIKAGGSLEHGKEEDAQQAFESSASSINMISLGAQPVGDDPVAWAREVNQEPMPISYTLDSICKLIDDDQKQANCNNALEASEYCTKRLMNGRGAVGSCQDPPVDPACLWHIDCDGTDACVENKCYETALVHQYWNNNDKDWSLHFPPACPNEEDQTGTLGEPFYAFKSTVPNTKQLHQYWHNSDKDWSVHFPPAWGGEEDQTGTLGAPFYAFDHQADGTDELHRYWNNNDKDWSFHFPPACPNEEDQTKPESFYAYNALSLTGRPYSLSEAFNATVVV